MKSSTSRTRSTTATAKRPAKTTPSRSRATKPRNVAAPTPQPVANRAEKSAQSSAQSTARSSNTSKQAQLIALLQGAKGASVDEMMDLTGWQAHTVRGTISGVLKKRLGLTVASEASSGNPRRYRIVASA